MFHITRLVGLKTFGGAGLPSQLRAGLCVVPSPFLGVRCFGKAKFTGFFGDPPQRATKQFTGVHPHPGMIHGWKSPQKRRGKEKRLPNVKPRPYDYRIAPSGDGQFYFMAPYPPRVNRTIDPYPHGDKNKWPTKVHKKYPMRWKNIEYIYEPRLQRKPFANGHQRWTGPVTRIEHVGKKKTIKSLVTHDARLLDWS